MNINNLLSQIFTYDPDGPNIHHLMSVHAYSRLIAQMENVDEHTLFITELAAYLHDIGVKISKEKYGNSQQGKQNQWEVFFEKKETLAFALPVLLLIFYILIECLNLIHSIMYPLPTFVVIKFSSPAASSFLRSRVTLTVRVFSST